VCIGVRVVCNQRDIIGYLDDIDQFPISSSHLVRVHNLVPPSKLEDVLVKLGVCFKVAIGKQFLSLNGMYK
jgi:hypothetical protein